jgi:hypothetical protein
VRVRGHRVDLTEIEETLRRAPGVRQVAVAAIAAGVTELGGGGEPGGIRLAAYLVPKAGVFDLAEVQRFVRAEEPVHRTPSLYVALAALPLTPDGEVDYPALAASAPVLDGSEPAVNGYVAPRSEIEQALAAVWAEVLGHERVGLRHSFWELGGHSLLAAKVLARVAKAFEVELPFDTLFKHPHLEDFALVVADRLMSGDLEDEEADLPLVAR